MNRWKHARRGARAGAVPSYLRVVRRASGHFGDQNSFGRVSCFTFRWVAVFRVSRPAPSPSALYYRPPAVFHRPPCFVFHYFQRPCVSLCFVFQNLGGAVKARVSCFVFQIFRACSAPAARLASGGACGGLSPLRDENLLRAAWISPTRGNGRNFRRKPVLPRPHMYVWPPARVGQAGLYLQTALKVVDS